MAQNGGLMVKVAHFFLGPPVVEARFHTQQGLAPRSFCTVDGNQKSGDHQLRLVVYPSIYKGLYIPGASRFLPYTVFHGSKAI